MEILLFSPSGKHHKTGTIYFLSGERRRKVGV
jgi:hypothetical protein